jgi:hypothetical protein
MNEHWHVIFAPLLPTAILAPLAAAAALLAGAALYRQAQGAWLRTNLLALLLLALTNPSLLTEKREPLKDTALLVIDDSASMRLGTRAEQATQATESIAKKLSAFSDLDVEILHSTGENETDLFHTIEQKLSQLPNNRLAGIIAVTDGQIHDTPQTPLSAPFHALIAGQKKESDRRVIMSASPAYGIVNQKAEITLRVEDEPKAQTENAVINMTGENGTTKTLTVPVGKDVKIEADITHAGINTFAFETEPLPKELTSANNTVLASINGIRDRLRVLLVSGEPHSGGRNWRNLLKADPAVDLVHFTILRSPLKDSAAPNKELSLIAFPSQEIFDTKLKSFDLVIFDGFGTGFLIPDRYLANIARYVEEGGALLVSNATGNQAAELSQSPLARILPTTSKGEVLTGPFVPEPTEAGKRHPVTVSLTAAMPRKLWAPWYRQADARINKDDSEILLTGLNQKPLLVLSHARQGRVAQFLSNQFWLWTKQYPNGGPENELLRRTAHWLVSEPELDETALHTQVEHTETGWQILIEKRSLHNDTADVTVTGPENQPLHVKLTASETPGMLRATQQVKETGLYHIKDDKHEILVQTGNPNTPEFGAMVATSEKLEALAKASSGTTMWLADYPGGPEIRRTEKTASQNGWGWIGLKKNGQYRITGSNATPLWPAWAILSIILVIAMWAWRREGR